MPRRKIIKQDAKIETIQTNYEQPHEPQGMTAKTLRYLVKDRILRDGPEADLNDIDVHNVTDFSGIFRGVDFRGKIDKWDVSNGIFFMGMFEDCSFNGKLPKNFSSAETMSLMFAGSQFNQDLDLDTPNLISTWGMFCGAKFNATIKLNAPKLLNTEYMFSNSLFNKPVDGLMRPHIIYTSSMFDGAKHFDQDMSMIDFAPIVTYANIFRNCPMQYHREFWPKNFEA